MCGFSWQLQLHPLQPPSAHMVRSEQGALTQPARGLAGAAMRAVLDPSAALWQPVQGTRTWGWYSGAVSAPSRALRGQQ